MSGPIDKDDPDRRIAALEARVARLESRLAAIELRAPQPKPTPPPRAEEPSVRIMQTVAPANIAMPTPDEMRRLHDIVTARWPATVASCNADEALAMFGTAFAYLAANVSHADRRTKYSIGSWCDKAEWHFQSIGKSGDVRPGSLAAAAAALGFAHTAFTGPPFSWDLWIGEGGHRLPDPKYWRGLLKGVVALKPPIDEAKGQSRYPVAQPTISGGDGAVGPVTGRVDTW